MQTNLADWKYQTDDVILLPYVNGSGNWPEDFLVRIYYSAREHNVLDKAFPGMEKMTLAGFIAYMVDKPLIVGVVKDGYTIVGFGWLHGAEGELGARKASVGFLFFRKFWGKSELRTIARLALKWWFDELKVNIIFGFTLATNSLAKRFAREVGFRYVADIPMFFSRKGTLHDASCVVITAEEFRESEQWAVIPPRFDAR